MSLLRLLPTAPLSRLRLVVLLIMGAALVPACFRLGCVKGLVRTIRIDGPSMAETLLGNHFRVTCGDCGIPFRCDADSSPDDRLAVCPSCAIGDNALRDEDLHLGDTVLVDTWPYLWSAPKRGDLVMLVEPKMNDEPSSPTFAVKRVAGLPREQPSIHFGDFRANGKAVRRTPRELREVSCLVHDSDYRPRSLPNQRRWLPYPAGATGWEATDGGFRFTSPVDTDESQWLAYEHWHSSASPAPRTQPAMILDNDSYNQAEARGLSPVRDLTVRCKVQGRTGDFILALLDPPHKLIVHLQLDSGRFLMLKDGSTIIAEALPHTAGDFLFEAAICDGSFRFSHNRHLLAEFVYREQPSPDGSQKIAESAPRIQIGAYGGPIEVTHLQVRRDIYYLTPTGLGGDWQMESPLDNDRFFLLGDNPPISVDSRQWGGGVAREAILGRVIPLGR